VVALHHDVATRGVLGHHLDHGRGVGPVAHEVAEEGMVPHAPVPRVREAGAKRLEVRMDVGEQGDDHLDPHVARSTAPGAP